MVDTISIALSGLTAQRKRLNVTANNIANMSTAGAVPTADQASTVYRPLQVSFQTLGTDQAAAGVKAVAKEKVPSYSVIFSPNSSFADDKGRIAVPNVDLAEESVNLLLTRTAWKANLAALRTLNDMEKQLIDRII